MHHMFISVLDLNNQTERVLFSHFRTISLIQGKMKSSGFLAYRVFNWNNYPEWMSLKKRGARDSAYAWKVISLCDVFNEWKAITVLARWRVMYKRWY